MKFITQQKITDMALSRKSNPENNSLFSPTCNVVLFQLLRELVDEESRRRVERSFDFDFLHMERFLKCVNRDDEKLATKIYQIKDSPLEKDSETLVREKFNIEIETFKDVIDPLDLEKSIEDWLKTYSNDTFKELINGPSINRVTSYNINWDKIFDKSKTTNEKFQHNPNESMDVDMMNISGKFKYFEDDSGKIIELPCINKVGTKSNDFSVLIFLPVNSFSMILPSENMWLDMINKMEDADVEISVPKFKIKNECDIIDLIGGYYGNSQNATFNLTKFVNANSYVSKIITQGFLEINEDNIIAVATTGCDICFQPLLKEILIVCDVTNRFAKTLLKHKFNNPNIKAQETTFSVILPENAFITEFEMIIEGKSYKSYVKEKEEAKKTYNEAVASGKSAAHVAVSARDSNKFTVSVNVAPKSDAQFLLTYEELLERKLNQYELVLNIHPEQLLEKLNVTVNIEESSKIRFVKTPPIRSGNEITVNNEENALKTTVDIDNSKAIIRFTPDKDAQKEIAKILKKPEHKGIAGQFVIQYDVEMNEEGGEVLLRDGYFVHFYMPDNLPVLPKHVVFALDTSGSMSGRKIQQLRDAMTYILDQILPDDLISLLDFKHKVVVHDVENQGSVSMEFSRVENYLECMHKFEEKNLPQPKQATEEIIRSAKQVAENLQAEGSTHIIGALEVSVFLVNRARDQWKNHQPIIVFLTDGEPTHGIRIPDQITDVITRLNMDSRVPIFTLSFGEQADKHFLRKLSLKNYAFSRHIYEAADASLQLQQFYKQISSPVMSNVTFKYEDNVEDITRVNFPIYFRGGDLVICGRYEVPDHLGVVRCHRNGLDFILNPRVKKSFGQLERFWAFLTVKQTLERSKHSDDKENLRKRAMELALKYSFVTEVTSLVVVKPEEKTEVDPENAAIPGEQNRYNASTAGGYRMMSASGLFGAQPLSAYTVPSETWSRRKVGKPRCLKYNGATFGSSSSYQNTSLGITFGASSNYQDTNSGITTFGSSPNYQNTISSGITPCRLRSSYQHLSSGMATFGFGSNYQNTNPVLYQLGPLLKKKKDDEKDSSLKQFKADRPFVIILQSKDQYEIVVLFIGKINKPVY